MEKFKFEGKEYNIVSEHKNSADGLYWEEKFTDCERIREIFAFRPWWIGKKFRWLKKITLKENLQFIRYSGFDDGWSYQDYWKPWKARWEVIEIL